MSNKRLPVGAHEDSMAPWNAQDYCRHCDIDQIRSHAQDMAEDPSDDTAVDAITESLLADTGLCRACKEEETSDFRDDY